MKRKGRLDKGEISVRQTVIGTLVTYYQGSNRRMRKRPGDCIRSFYVERLMHSNSTAGTGMALERSRGPGG
jgi:hypothetical protein